MQYPIIDNLIYAYQRNGWTGLEIIEGKNLFDYQNVSSTPTLINNNGVFTNAATDSRTSVRWRIRLRQGNTTVFNSPSSNASIGLNSITFDASEYSYDVLALVISGVDRDMVFFYRFSSNEMLTMSFNLISNDPTVIGGIVFDNVQLEKGTEATPYEPYAPPTTDIKNLLKLPMIHYFPHPVIDAIISAADGQHTEEEKEILRHYLTPLGIGGI